MTTKICTKCELEKDLKEFYKTSTTKDGYTYNCISCYQLYRESHREQSVSYMKKLRETNPEKLNEVKRNSWRNLDPRKKMFQQCLHRAKRKHLEFNITIEDIIIPDECPILGLPFVIGIKGDYQQAPSLDRIDPNKGYIRGNIWVLSNRANTMKSNAGKEELIRFSLAILKHFGDDDIVRTIWKHIESENKESQS